MRYILYIATRNPERNMDQDAIDFFNAQAAAKAVTHARIGAKAKASGSFARHQWMAAALEALRSGAKFSERATRRIAKPWDGRMTALSISCRS